MSSTGDVARAIEELVTQTPLAGSKLRRALDERFPGWSPQSENLRSLREFIAKHVPTVAICGRAGFDIIYGPASAAVPHDAATPMDTRSVNAWRVWVSPRSRYTLLLSADRRSLSVASTASTGDGSLAIQPPGVDFHRTVARDFLTQLPQESHAHLEAALSSPDDSWWPRWVEAIAAAKATTQWQAHRKDRFSRRLRTALEDAGVPSDAASEMLDSLRSSPEARRPRPSRGKSEDAEVEQVRRIMLAAVARMSLSELRDLRVPAGILLDVLNNSAAK